MVWWTREAMRCGGPCDVVRDYAVVKQSTVVKHCAVVIHFAVVKNFDSVTLCCGYHIM